MPTAWLSSATFREPRGDVTATYEHPALIRLCHWLGAVSIVVMAASGLQILRAFPAFGAKVPQHDLLTVPSSLALGGWLAGGLQWHFTFMWIFMGAAAVYLAAQALTGRFRMVLFAPRDVPGVWPMVRHYFLFGPRPQLTEPYNALQKLAYTTTLAFAGLSMLSGLVLYKPAQFSPLAFLLGGYHAARIWHFVAMCGLLAFIPGHLLMVALHGWDNFAGMLVGWKRNPEYLAAEAGTGTPQAEQPCTTGADVALDQAPEAGGVTPPEVQSDRALDAGGTTPPEVQSDRALDAGGLTPPEVQSDGAPEGQEPRDGGRDDG